jgi:hypothetical protein
VRLMLRIMCIDSRGERYCSCGGILGVRRSRLESHRIMRPYMYEL